MLSNKTDQQTGRQPGYINLGGGWVTYYWFLQENFYLLHYRRRNTLCCRQLHFYLTVETCIKYWFLCRYLFTHTQHHTQLNHGIRCFAYHRNLVTAGVKFSTLFDRNQLLLGSF
jgi:hypothetical protein